MISAGLNVPLGPCMTITMPVGGPCVTHEHPGGGRRAFPPRAVPLVPLGPIVPWTEITGPWTPPLHYVGTPLPGQGADITCSSSESV